MDIGNLDNVFQKKNDKTTTNKDNTAETRTKADDATKTSSGQDTSLDDMMSQVGDYDANGRIPAVPASNQDDDSDDDDEDTNAREEKEDLNKPDAKTALAAEAVATGTTQR